MPTPTPPASVIPDRIDLYLDLDGVLADFDAGLRRLGHATDPGMNRSREEMDTDARARKDALYAAIAGTPFFRELPPTPDAHRLWTAVRHLDPVILTAVPRFDDPAHFAEAGDHKHAWVCATFEPIPRTRFVATTSRDKPRFMNPASPRPQVLIDDRSKNVEAWRAAGGIGVLHTTAADSLAQLARAA
jgi:hypothetical protein